MEDIQYVQELCSIPFPPPSNIQSLWKMGFSGGVVRLIVCLFLCVDYFCALEYSPD